MNKRKEIEKEPLSREILIHAAMHYQCDCCEKIFRFWLEKGLEDRKQDRIRPDNHKPVPFSISCLCGGTAQHIAWNKDIYLNAYMQLGENMNYFENTEDDECGIPHFRNNNTVEIRKEGIPSGISGCIGSTAKHVGMDELKAEIAVRQKRELTEELQNLCILLAEPFRKIEELCKQFEYANELGTPPTEIKRRLKYAKNPMEIKQLNRQLAAAYKKYRKVRK